MIGVDADARAPAKASRHAARPQRRGGLPNAIFLVGSAEALPGALAGRADLLTIALPWGSLLRALLDADASVLGRIAATLREGGEIELFLSAAELDGAGVTLATEQDAARLAADYERACLQVRECRPATAQDVARLSSAWGRRLDIPRRRAAWLYRLRPTAPPRRALRAARAPHAP